MKSIKDQFYSAPTRVQDGVLFLLLEAAIYLAISFIDLKDGRSVSDFGTAASFAGELTIIVLIAVTGMGVLYGKLWGWIGSLIMSVVLMFVGCLFMLDIVPLTLVLSGLFYFIFGLISFCELVRKDFRVFCGFSAKE